jgi:hypothetical protein
MYTITRFAWSEEEVTTELNHEALNVCLISWSMPDNQTWSTSSDQWFKPHLMTRHDQWIHASLKTRCDQTQWFPLNNKKMINSLDQWYVPDEMWSNSEDIGNDRFIMFVCLFVCLFVLFIVAWAIFQLSGDCHHCRWRGCKFRPMLSTYGF